MEDALTPVVIERKLRQLINDLGRARVALAGARDEEVTARHAYNAARRKAVLSPAAPRVERNGATTAERDAWVGERVADLEFAHDRAVVVREAAQDHLRVLREQAELVRSLGASVRQAYELAGRGEGA